MCVCVCVRKSFLGSLDMFTESNHLFQQSYRNCACKGCNLIESHGNCIVDVL